MNVRLKLFETLQNLLGFREMSIEVDVTMLPRLLQAVRSQLPSGFSDLEIAGLQADFASLAVDQRKVYSFPFSYDGSETTLRLILRKEAADTVELRLWARPKLTAAITAAVRDAPLDVIL